MKENLRCTKEALGLWNNQTSGISIPEELAFELENQWIDFQERNSTQFVAHSNSEGSGYGNHLNNVEVETAAIDNVRSFYLKNGWKVKSVERERCGFDLVCTKGSLHEDVEVKGISGSGYSFIITAGEVNQAQTNPKFALCVVVNALSAPQLLHFTREEFLSKFVLEPTQYRARLKRGAIV